jgi:predicted Zn-dependent peptidase
MSLVQPTNLRGKEFGASKPQPLEQHPNLVTGKLENGLTYYILPNKVPAGRFEAHLEVLSGSANELESQQGMAHLLEHVAYMGSPKRQLISSTGSRTNAYTDFHHTVFYASCPVETQDSFWKKPLLPMAFDALIDVMTTKVNDERMEKERAAVLSEASMVNKMEYRVECQVLSALHSENRQPLAFFLVFFFLDLIFIFIFIFISFFLIILNLFSN